MDILKPTTLTKAVSLYFSRTSIYCVASLCRNKILLFPLQYPYRQSSQPSLFVNTYWKSCPRAASAWSWPLTSF